MELSQSATLQSNIKSRGAHLAAVDRRSCPPRCTNARSRQERQRRVKAMMRDTKTKRPRRTYQALITDKDITVDDA